MLASIGLECTLLASTDFVHSLETNLVPSHRCEFKCRLPSVAFGLLVSFGVLSVFMLYMGRFHDFHCNIIPKPKVEFVMPLRFHYLCVT